MFKSFDIPFMLTRSRVIFDKGTQDREDGYFYGAVAPCYDECTADSGTASKYQMADHTR